MGGAWVHRVISATEDGALICSNCGPVRGVRKHGRWKCAIARDIQRQRPPNIPRPHGPCAICNNIAKPQHWDHDHTTGEFRGWLCSTCNSGLGFFRDNPYLLRAAARYLEAPRAP